MIKLIDKYHISFDVLIQNNEKNKKIMKIILVLFIAVVTLTVILKSMNPIFEASCIEKVQAIATNITNIESSKILKQKNYVFY